MKRRLFPGLVCLVCLVAFAQEGWAQTRPLSFFKSYLETGSHFAVGVQLKGTGVNGFADADIVVPADNPATPALEGVPEGADVLAAYLYWLTLTSSTGSGAIGAQFNYNAGLPLQPDSLAFGDISRVAKNLNPNGTAPCWSAGGATGDGGEARTVKAYRADVMPFLPVAADGRRTAVGTHHLRLPDVGNGNAVPVTSGATLFIVFRAPGMPLTSTVLFDGGFTLNQSTPMLVQPLEGWYQAQSAGATATLTQAVANGQSNFTELMTVSDVNGAVETPVYTTSNPFVGPSWDTHTATFAVPGDSSKAKVVVQRGSTTGSYDCISWGAMAYTVPVQDGDADGIIDRLESQTTSGTITDPRGQLLPDLYAMGARPNIKDIFIEFGFMKSSAGYTNALGQNVPAGHSHVVAREALDRMARAFHFATPRINVHYDIGNRYQDGAMPPGGFSNCATASDTDWTPNCAIIRAANADGGELIEELPCDTSTKACTFPEYPAPQPCVTVGGCQFAGVPGTVGWKSGMQAYRDEPLNFRKTAPYTVNNKTFQKDIGPDEIACSMAESDLTASGMPDLTTNCTRRFARTRRGLFHYALWIHATGIPKSDDPSSPLYNLPKNISGMADFLGGDIAISLGLWDGATGSAFMQASTLMHELGHNLGRRHGGLTGEPNCKPNYLSIMNYLFQVGGLLNSLGVPQIDYSKQTLSALDENALSESAGLGVLDYRTRWYAPWSTSFLAGNLNITPVSKRCNGSPVVGEVMARITGTTTSGPIDWNGNGVTDLLPLQQDINFSGSEAYDQLNAGSNDWASLDLRQVASRRNVGGWSVNSGYWDAGYWDAGYWDAGYWDAGYWDAGYWDAGYWDAGYWDAGYWDAGVEPDAPLGEVDLDNAEAAGLGPNSVSANLAGKNVQITWSVPVVGADKVHHYEVYRFEGTAVTPANLATKTQIGGMILPPTTQAIDTTAKTPATYVYGVLAEFLDGRRSGMAFSPPFSKK